MTVARVLTPSAIAAIDDLELAARLIVEGAHTGRHRSPFHGFAAEFSQYRPYRPGDDLKYLDWKLLGRTDRLYSRRFRETTDLSTMLVVDASASMDFPAVAPSETSRSSGALAGKPDGISKFRYAVILAAALAYVIIEQGDKAGLMTMVGDRFVYLPPRGGRSHLHAVLAQLARLKPGGSWNIDRAVTRGAELLKRRGLMVAISDFYDATELTARELRRVGRRGHDVALLQVLSPAEISFPYSGAIEFEHLESDARWFIDAGDAAPGYRDAVSNFLTAYRAQAHKDGHDYALLTTDIAPDRALRSYLLRRTRLSSRVTGARPGLR